MSNNSGTLLPGYVSVEGAADFLESPNGVKQPTVTPPAVETTKTTPHKESSLDKFQKCILDQNKEYPLPEAVINLVQNLEKVPVLTLKSFSLWQGKQKSKKTILLALAVAAYLRQYSTNEGIRFECGSIGKVLFFDNEQGLSYAARTMKLILKLIGLKTSPNLIYCDLREFAPQERVEIIQAGIESTEGVKLVVIDGLVDLMTDFMDPAEGHLSITNIIKLCSVYNIHIAGVLHQNKADKNARAHVGTISSQKCEIEISTEVDPQNRTQSLVTCVNSRGLPFEPFAIKWEKGSLPFICQDWSVTIASDEKASRKKAQIEEVARAIFKPPAALRNMDTIDRIMKATMKSEATAKRHLIDLQKWGIVLKGDDGLYRLNMEKGSEGSEGSNERS